MDLWQVIKVAFIEHFVFAWQIFNSTDSLSSASQPNLKQLILWVLRWKIELHSSWTTSIFKIVISAKYGIDRNNQAFCPLWNISTWSHCLCLKWYHDPLQIGRQYRYTFQEVRGGQWNTPISEKLRHLFDCLFQVWSFNLDASSLFPLMMIYSWAPPLTDWLVILIGVTSEVARVLLTSKLPKNAIFWEIGKTYLISSLACFCIQ